MGPGPFGATWKWSPAPFATSTLTVDGGEIAGPARELLFELMSAVWARDGFRVRDAASFIEIATAVGVPASTVEAEHLPDDAIDVDSASASGRDEGYMRTLVLVDGELRFAAVQATTVAELGLARLDELRRLPDLAEAKHLAATMPPMSWDETPPSLVRRLDDAIVIDTRERRLELSTYQLQRSTSRRHFEALWPGYTLASYASMSDVLRRIEHPELVAPPDPPAPPIEEQLAAIESFLFGTRSDPVEMMARIMEREPGGWVNPHALVSPGDGRPRDAASANEIFRAVVETCFARDASLRVPVIRTPLRWQSNRITSASTTTRTDRSCLHPTRCARPHLPTPTARS